LAERCGCGEHREERRFAQRLSQLLLSGACMRGERAAECGQSA
jgi:hypothetical protein